MEKEQKHIKLVLDCKTRWSSLLPIFERLIKLQDCIKKALKEFGQMCLYNEKDFDYLKMFVYVLKPVDLSVKELSKSGTNLLAAEGIITFLLEQLEENTSYIKILRKELKRGEICHCYLYKYLEIGVHPQTSECVLSYSSKEIIYELAESLTTRLFPYSDDKVKIESRVLEGQDEENIVSSGTLIQKMHSSISKIMNDFEPQEKILKKVFGPI